MAIQTARQGGLERIAKIPIVINGRQIDVPLPRGTNRYFSLIPAGPTHHGHRYIVEVYRGPAEENGYMTFGREKQPVQLHETYRLADDVKKLHFGTG